ncbi:hypothetical protein DFH06DRAFT_1462589 [Mycena polygramma]|nr:hypothetical protein DFH06DRAFT_1462589 [Mycena polygramma]
MSLPGAYKAICNPMHGVQLTSCYPHRLHGQCLKRQVAARSVESVTQTPWIFAIPEGGGGISNGWVT